MVIYIMIYNTTFAPKISRCDFALINIPVQKHLNPFPTHNISLKSEENDG